MVYNFMVLRGCFQGVFRWFMVLSCTGTYVPILRYIPTMVCRAWVQHVQGQGWSMYVSVCVSVLFSCNLCYFYVFSCFLCFFHKFYVNLFQHLINMFFYVFLCFSTCFLHVSFCTISVPSWAPQERRGAQQRQSGNRDPGKGVPQEGHRRATEV